MSFVGMLAKAGISNDTQGNLVIKNNLFARNYPAPYGAVYYVSKNGNGNSGRSWAEAFTTIAEAITVMRARIDWSASPWAKNDILYIGPGTYAENLTTLPHGCMIIGAGWDNRDGQFGTKIAPATGAPIDVGGIINTAFINIGFQTTSTSKCFDGGIVNNCLFQGCRFEGAAETSTAAKLFETVDATRTKWIDCEFSCGDVGFDILAAGGDPYSKMAHCLMQDCRFDQIDTAAIRTTAGLTAVSNLVIRAYIVGGGVTCAIGVDDNAAALDLLDCRITATDPVQGCRSAEGCYGNGALLGSNGEA